VLMAILSNCRRDSICVPLCVFALVTLSVSLASAQDFRGYKAFIDLKNVEHDRARVAVHLPPLFADSAVIVFPRTIPGTYDEQRYADYVVHFNPVDSNGQSLPWSRTIDGQFLVPNARRLYFLTYLVDDTFDNTDTLRASGFGPEGTSIQNDTIMQINHGGFLPYVDGMQDYPYAVMITKPKSLFGASSLDIVRLNDTTDSYGVRNYDQLIDHPVLYAVADTASFTIGTTRVLVACAHRSRHSYAKKFAPILERACQTIGRFLPSMPVSKYAFLFYLWDGKPVHSTWNTTGYGALEHGTSSLFYLLDSNADRELDEIAIHEFLHILVPLNLHSEEIASFNFRTPRMSRHLWLYEGVTEYHSMLARVRDSTITERAFLAELERKTGRGAALPLGVSFTDFSQSVLDSALRDSYPIVYTYGVVNAAMLDIMLRRETKGRMGLLELIFDLMKDFGPTKPFVDSTLFSEIERRTTPAFGAFLRKHVGGTDPLPISDVLQYVGLRLDKSALIDFVGYGVEIDIQQSMGSTSWVLKAEDSNELNAITGDVIEKLNGRDVSHNSQGVFEALFQASIGKELTLSVRRSSEVVTLSGKAAKRKVRRPSIVVEESLPEQRSARNTWLRGKP